MTDSKRLYGIDLFKALAMFLVIILHTNTIGGALHSSVPGSAQWWTADFAESASYCCVNCFALATGFLMVGRAFRPGHIVSLWLQAVFYSVLIAVLRHFATPEEIGLRYVAEAFFPVLTSKYWYFSAYFIMFFFIPFLNAMLGALDRRGRKMLLIAIFVFTSLLPTFKTIRVMPLEGGYCALWLTLLYLIGACVKLDKLYERADGKFFVFVYFAMIAFMLLWQALRNLDNVRFVNYVSPTVLLCAVSLLCAFCRLRVPDRLARPAKYLGSTSFAVYLIHTNEFMRGRFTFISGLHPVLMLPCEVGCAAAIWIVCMLIETLRKKLFALCGIDRLAAAIADRLDRAYLNEGKAG